MAMPSKLLAAVLLAGSAAIAGVPSPYPWIDYVATAVAVICVAVLLNINLMVESLNFGSRVVTGFPPARMLFFGSVRTFSFRCTFAYV